MLDDDHEVECLPANAVGAGVDSDALTVVGVM